MSELLLKRHNIKKGVRWVSSRNCQDTGTGRQGHWLVMWSLLFHLLFPSSSWEKSFFWVRESHFFSLFSFCHIYPHWGLLTSPARKLFRSTESSEQWVAHGAFIYWAHLLSIWVCWPLHKSWGHGMNRIHPRLQGALPSRKNLEQVIGSGLGSLRPESAVCEGSGSPVCHLPSPLR